MELRECPFCKSEAIATDEMGFYELVEKHGRAAIDIRCTNPDCGCQYWLYSHQHQTHIYEVALEEAIERWNHRAEDEESESL